MLRSRYYEVQIDFGKLLYKRLPGVVWRISRHRVIKTSMVSGPNELSAMRYVADHTAVPVPKVYNIYQNGRGEFCIIMEFIEGIQLERI